MSNLPQNIPSPADLLRLPKAEGATYLLTDKEIRTLRSRLYKLNSNNVKGWRWRSTKTGHAAKAKRTMLLVWGVS